MMYTEPSPARSRRFLLASGLAALVLLALRPAAADEHGYRDFNFGITVNSTPTGEKPECKLWYNDGSWWGSLWADADSKFHIYEFHWDTQTWSDTGTALDDRRNSKADVLWDEAAKKLYLVSGVFNVNPAPTVLQFACWLDYLVLVLALFLHPGQPPKPVPPPSTDLPNDSSAPEPVSEPAPEPERSTK